MPALATTLLRLEKRVPLTISRGTITHSPVIWLRWAEDGIEGWGEAVPFGIDSHPQTEEHILTAFETHRPWLEAATAASRHLVEQRLWNERAPSALIAAINQAMFDWLGKRAGLPVWTLLGLPSVGPLTSVTVGISTRAAAKARVRQWLDAGDVRAFKIKLGAPAGIATDQAMFDAVLDVVPAGARMSVDANGGWSLKDACTMVTWLAERGVDHVEQPLPVTRDDDLSELKAASPLPIIIDESCHTSVDIARLAPSISGINIKLMKCGGLDGALRLAHTARAHHLRVLIGCYGNSALGNTCAATLGGLADYLDLDSHLNIADDPFTGATLHGGRLVLPALPGFGLCHE